MRETGHWRPLFDPDTHPEETAGAWAAVRGIAEALREPAPDEVPSAEAPALPQLLGAGLSTGNAGLAVFFTYLAQATGEEAFADLAAERLDRAMDVVASRPMSPALYGGFSGVAWTMEHLQGRLFVDAPEEAPDEAKEDEEGADEGGEADPTAEGTLLQILEPQPWPGDYDLINGLVGFAVYGLETLPKPEARELLERIVEQLEAAAEETPTGTTWFTRPELLPPHQRERYPGGYYNLGVAHGVPGIVGALARIHGAGVLPERSLALLEKTVPWVLAQEWEAPAVGRCFPHFHIAGNVPEATRLAWCYGDPGIAAALLLAARETGRKDWEEKALEVAARAAARPEATAQIRDAGVCHGAAGLGHLFNRLYQATGREELGDAARFWFGRTLEMRKPGEGVGGILSWDTMKGGWWPERGFLTGAAGVALALLGAVTPLAPDWDRVLLIS